MNAVAATIRQVAGALPVLALGLCLETAAGGLRWIGTPDGGVTPILDSGAVREPWDEFRIVVKRDKRDGSAEEGAARGPAAVSAGMKESVAAPVAATTFSLPPVVARIEVVRAPAWPRSWDLVDVVIDNSGDSAAGCVVILEAPEGFVARPGRIQQGAFTAVALAPPPSRLACSACLTNATAMPGWARPAVACDPGYRNIRAGMGGIPIRYRVRVEPRGKRRVVLGFCESYWSEKGKRPLTARVEGAEARTFDPLVVWGQHHPGALAFSASDVNGDGGIEIEILPVQGAPDCNPILNMIWVFPAETPTPLEDVVAGRLNGKAVCRVDVGGVDDGPVYVAGRIDLQGNTARYPLQLEGKGRVRLSFLLARDRTSVPVWSETTWTAAALRNAAEHVWRDWFADSANPAVRDLRIPETVHSALCLLIAARIQDDDYYVMPADPSRADTASPGGVCLAAAAFDAAGFHLEAERLLRVLWDRPVPPAFSRFAIREDGVLDWPADPVRTQSAAVYALAAHAVASRDKEWVRRVWPVLKKAALALGRKIDPSGPDERTARGEALALAAQIARMAGDQAAGDYLEKAAAPRGRKPNPGARAFLSWAPAPEGACTDAAKLVLRSLSN